MAIDEDIAASLPKPPPPAPARRDAAIGAALARFDGVSPTPAPVRQKARFGRPQIGVLVSAALVAFVGIPALWISTKDPVAVTQRGAPEQAKMAEPTAEKVAEPQAEAPQISRNDVVEPEPRAPAEAAATGHPAIPAQPAADMAAPKEPEMREEITVTAARRASMASPAPVSVSASEMLSAPGRDAETAQRQERDDAGADNIVVTGAKISRPAAARARRARERSDRTCTIDDPARDLAACRRLEGARGQAGAAIADGLSRAWRGDYDGAILNFSKAIAADPKSGIAYLNRGLAHRANGEEAQAAADLKRARKLGND